MKKWAFLVAMLLLTGSLSIPLSVSATDVPVDTEVATTLTNNYRADRNSQYNRGCSI